MSAVKAKPAASESTAWRNARLHEKSLAARKEVRETYRSFRRIEGGDAHTAAQLTSAWAILMGVSFEGDGR